MTEGNEMIKFSEEGEDQPSERKEQIQSKNYEEQKVRQYDNEYNQQPGQGINDLKPMETDQQQLVGIQEGDEGFLKKMKSCGCRRDREAKVEEKEEKSSEGCISKLDKLIQKYLTPLYLLLVYYTVFFTLVLYCLKLIFIDDDWTTFEILVGTFVFAQFVKGLLIYFLIDEWWDELPYLDSTLENASRATGISFAVLLNLDICYWVYQIYSEQKRDSTIEHMMAMCRMIDAFYLNIPLMIGFFLFQMMDDDELNIPYLVIAGANLLAIVNGFMHLNFFGGSSFLSIRWSIQFICELYVKLLLGVSVYCQLAVYGGVQYVYFGLFGIFGLIQFYLFSDDSDFIGQVLSMVYFQWRTLLVVVFKETSFGMSDLDCEAQPGILNVVLTRELFTYIQKAFNLFQLISLGFIFWLFGGLEIIKENQLVQLMYIVALPCAGIQLLNLIYVFFSGWSKNMLKQKP